MYRALLCLFVCMSMICFTTSFAPARAQEGVVWEVRGNRVPLLEEPNGSSAVVAMLRKGEALRVIGEAQHRSGETRVVDSAALTPSISWFVPVEVISTGQTGWLPELRIRARTTGDAPQPVDQPAEGSIVETTQETASREDDASTEPSSTPSLQPVSPSPTPVQLDPPPTAAPVVDHIEPELIAEEAAYVAAMLPISQGLPASLTRFTDLIETPRVGDSAWEDLIQVEVDNWHDVYDQAEALTPPASLANVHSTFLLGLSYQVESGDMILKYFRTLDINDLEKAASLAGKSPPLVEEASRLFEEYMVSRGVTPP